KSIAKKLYYPGEVLFSNVPVTTLAFCEQVSNKNNEQLLVRPIEIYEFPYQNLTSSIRMELTDPSSPFTINSQFIYSYKSNQSLKGKKNVKLVSNVITFQSKQLLNKNHNIELVQNRKSNSLNFCLSEKIYFNKFITPDLQYKNIQSSNLIQQKQFIDKYSVLGYLESVTVNSLEIVKFKIKKNKK
ncbi:hypothetical protein, partial [Arcobacter sp.]|uniref:hypothetical protein n=1 Tax=Arcobacter sp. TaxID=1872629 RepID=UPI003D10B5DA